MYRFIDTEEVKTYISSDFHLNHDPKWTIPIWKMRGYNSASDMTDGIIAVVNATVRPNDNLLFLGDFCLNTPPDKFEVLISRINCRNIYMLWGNHPNSHYKNVYTPMVKRLLGIDYTYNSEIYPLRYKNVIYLGHYAEVVLNNQLAVLSHYPIMVWNHMAQGSWCLTGHSHGGCANTNLNNTYGKILDCGWDEHKRPLSIPEIAEIMEKKGFVAVDKHHIPNKS